MAGNADRLRGIGAEAIGPLIDEAPFTKLVCSDSNPRLPRNFEDPPSHAAVAAALCIADCILRKEQLKKIG